jgi:hypothetical protein
MLSGSVAVVGSELVAQRAVVMPDAHTWCRACLQNLDQWQEPISAEAPPGRVGGVGVFKPRISSCRHYVVPVHPPSTMRRVAAGGVGRAVDVMIWHTPFAQPDFQ